MNREILIIPEDTGEEKLIELWIRKHKNQHTQRTYYAAIRRLQTFAKKPLIELTLEKALDFRDSLSGLNDNTQRITINAVRSFYSFASDMKVFPTNVMKLIDPPTAKSAVYKRILPEATVINMIMSEPDLRNECALRLLYSAGLRVSEVCDLTWESVITLASGIGVIHIEKGKGDKSRDITLNDNTWGRLNELREKYKDSKYVITSHQKLSSKKEQYKGERVDPSTVFRIVRNAAKRVGVPNWDKVSPHWLRHCHGSHSFDRGVPVTVIRDNMGHSSIAITNTYGHANPEESSSRKLPL